MTPGGQPPSEPKTRDSVALRQMQMQLPRGRMQADTQKHGGQKIVDREKTTDAARRAVAVVMDMYSQRSPCPLLRPKRPCCVTPEQGTQVPTRGGGGRSDPAASDIRTCDGSTGRLDSAASRTLVIGPMATVETRWRQISSERIATLRMSSRVCRTSIYLQMQPEHHVSSVCLARRAAACCLASRPADHGRPGVPQSVIARPDSLFPPVRSGESRPVQRRFTMNLKDGI